MDIVKVTSDQIDVPMELSHLLNPECGGTACFIGTTRDNFNGKRVVELQYEAYESMATKQLQHIAITIRKKWPVRDIILIHRIGIVPISEASVLVVANAVHRKEALEAVSFGIDAIKAGVPIWKKEFYDDGTSNWKENCECIWAANCEK